MRIRGSRPAVRSKRVASAVLMVLVILVVVGALTAELLRTALLYRQAASEVAGRRQVQLLAEAALERAVLSLAASPEYRGETWRPEYVSVAAGEEKPPAVCEAIITVDEPGAPAATRRIAVHARMGDRSTRVSAQRTEIHIPVPEGKRR
jgi:hypothetical protein